jgi:hypothetical protein
MPRYAANLSLVMRNACRSASARSPVHEATTSTVSAHHWSRARLHRYCTMAALPLPGRFLRAAAACRYGLVHQGTRPLASQIVLAAGDDALA